MFCCKFVFSFDYIFKVLLYKLIILLDTIFDDKFVIY